MNRDEVLHVAALILGGQNAYRADTQSKNLKTIVEVAKELICEVNEQLTESKDTHSGSTSTPQTAPRTPSSQKGKSKKA